MPEIVSHNEKPPKHLEGMRDVKLLAYVWFCGDDCACSEPGIVWQFRNPLGVKPTGFQREAIWTGTFQSCEYGIPDDYIDPDEELRAECDRRGIALADSGGGSGRTKP